MSRSRYTQLKTLPALVFYLKLTRMTDLRPIQSQGKQHLNFAQSLDKEAFFFPIPYSLFPIPYSLFPIPASRSAK